MPFNYPPTSVLLSRKITRKPVYFLSHTSSLLAEMLLGYLKLCPDVDISCCFTPPHSSLHHSLPRHGNQKPGSNASPFSCHIQSVRKSLILHPKCLKSTSLHPQLQYWHLNFLISPFFPLNGQLPSLQWLPLQSIFHTETKLNLLKCKSNVPAFLVKIHMGSNIPQF